MLGNLRLLQRRQSAYRYGVGLMQLGEILLQGLDGGDRGLFFICGKRFPIVSPLQSTRGEFVVTPGIFLQKIIGSLKTSQSEKVKFGNFFEFIVNWFIEFMQISRDGLIAKQSF